MFFLFFALDIHPNFDFFQTVPKIRLSHKMLISVKVRQTQKQPQFEVKCPNDIADSDSFVMEIVLKLKLKKLKKIGKHPSHKDYSNSNGMRLIYFPTFYIATKQKTSN